MGKVQAEGAQGTEPVEVRALRSASKLAAYENWRPAEPRLTEDGSPYLCYFGAHCGGRFSLKAAMPSSDSGEVRAAR